MSIPHGYYRVLETHDNHTICVNSLDLDYITLNFYFAELNLNQFNLLYTIIISYIIPFIAIVTCYLIMINKLTKERNNKVSKNKKKISTSIFFVKFLRKKVIWDPNSTKEIIITKISFRFKSVHIFLKLNMRFAKYQLKKRVNPVCKRIWLITKFKICLNADTINKILLLTG